MMARRDSRPARHRVAAVLAALLLAPTANALIVADADDDSRTSPRERQFVQLVADRFDAIQTAFGSLSGVFGTSVAVSFKRAGERADGEIAYAARYDSEQNTLVFSFRVLQQALPGSRLWAQQYWPFYTNQFVRRDFPIIEVIDTALWEAFLQEAASTSGRSWPASECSSPVIAARLPCRMIVRGALEHVRQLSTPMFNENRLDRIMPEDFTVLFRRSVRPSSREYQDVERYGGIMLLKPLIIEFGIPRTLAYVARTPFVITEDNMLSSALRYQEQARLALSTPQQP